MTFDTAFDLDLRLADLAGQLAVAPAPASPTGAMQRAEGLYPPPDHHEKPEGRTPASKTLSAAPTQ